MEYSEIVFIFMFIWPKQKVHRNLSMKVHVYCQDCLEHYYLKVCQEDRQTNIKSKQLFTYQHHQGTWKYITLPHLYHMKTKPNGIFFGVNQLSQQTIINDRMFAKIIKIASS